VAMFKVFGKVEPPWYLLDFEFEPQITYTLPELNVELKCSVAIKHLW